MTNSTTKVYDEALQERVRKYMKDTGLSQNKLAPRIGMSGASLSNYMNCKMDGSVEGIESRLREFLQQESEAAAVQVQVAPYKLDETYKPTSISDPLRADQPHAGDAARRRRGRENEGCCQVLPR